MSEQDLEKRFRQYAEKEKETLKKHGKGTEEFVKEAMEWSRSVEGKLELDKFILSTEILHIEEEMEALRKRREKKQKAISEIDDELKKHNNKE
ncbi:hypothetical protein [Methanosphaera cuniculi]|uniref:hypothetical protein n=1 Tax=Methanosphaera cuniculi TaxID=1077256 RepID=UPI0026DBDA6D|nr:hypothetical protein [Methanosphaera cuniculi]